jgi:hypothetical protein
LARGRAIGRPRVKLTRLDEILGALQAAGAAGNR